MSKNSPKQTVASVPADESLEFWSALFRSRVIAFILIFAAGFAAYQSAFSIGWIGDSEAMVKNSPYAQQLNLTNIWEKGGDTAGMRPLVNLSYAFNYTWGDGQSSSYHLTNVLIHCLAALTLYGLLRGTMSFPRIAKAFRMNAAPLALMVSVLWVVHPATGMAVAYIPGRAELLLALAYLFALYAAYRAAFSQRKDLWRVLCVLGCVAGMACHEAMVTAPIAVYLYDAFFLSGSFMKPLQRRVGFYLALASSLAFLGFLIVTAESDAAAFYLTTTEDFGWWEYLQSQALALAIYFKLSVWPNPLIFDYGTGVVENSMWMLVSLVLLAIVLVLGVYALLKRKWWGLCIFIILGVCAAQTIWFTDSNQLIAEGRFYLPLAVLLTFLVLFIYSMWNKWVVPSLESEKARMVSASALCIALAAIMCNLSWGRADLFQDEIKLLSHNLRSWPTNPDVYAQRGLLRMEAKEVERAMLDFENGIKHQKSPYLAHYGRARLLNDMGVFASAEQDYKRAIELNPDFFDSTMHYVQLLLNQSRFGDVVDLTTNAIMHNPDQDRAYTLRAMANSQIGADSSAMKDVNTAIDMAPDHADHYFIRANLYAKVKNGKLADGDFRKAVELDPDNIRHLNGLHNMLRAQRKIKEAASIMDKVVELDPQNAETHFSRAMTYEAMGVADEAMESYGKTILLNPKYYAAFNNRGNILSRLGRTDEAIADLQSAIKLRPNVTAPYINMAGLYASTGRYDKAMEMLQRAYRMAPQSIQVKREVAWLMSTAPKLSNRDFDMALRFAVENTQKNPQLIPQDFSVLAAAFANKGQFDKAKNAVSRAIQMAANMRNVALEKEFRTHLEAYQQNQPYRTAMPQ